MIGRCLFLSFCLLVPFALVQPAVAASGVNENSKLVLKEDWRIQSSALLEVKGETLSTPQYAPKGWYRASVPTTVLGALIENKVYADPYYGMNLRSIPGTIYPIGDNFSNLPMPPESPFRVPWWYRKEFRLPPAYREKTVWLHLDGINFRANVWLNGKLIGDAKDVAGSFRFFEFNVSDVVKDGEANVLAVEVFPPQPDDLAITWVDVNPSPADKDMGLWQDVYLTMSGPVSLRYPQVISHLDLPSLEKAHLTVTALLHNTSRTEVRGVLKGEIEKISFQQEVALATPRNQACHLQRPRISPNSTFRIHASGGRGNLARPNSTP